MSDVTCILTKNDCYKANRQITPKGVMVHSTGANNPNVNRYVPIGDKYSSMHWDKPGLKKCVHAFLGKMPDGTIGYAQTLPWYWRGWHGGGASNNTHIGFEICEDGLKDPEYFNAVYHKAADLVAMLCKEYNLDPLKDGVVICHQEGYRRGIASNHADVLHWFPKFGKSMDDFRREVAALMGKKEEVTQMTQDDFDKLLAANQADKALDGYSNYALTEGVQEFVTGTGISDGFGPQMYATREQVFAMLQRFYNYIKNKED